MVKFNVVIEKDEDGYFISDVVELPGCHTQARTLEELSLRTKEAILLYLKSMNIRSVKEKFIRLQQVEV